MREPTEGEVRDCNCPVGVETAVEAIYRNRKTVYLSIGERCGRCKAPLGGYSDVCEFDTVKEAREYAETLKTGVW